MRRQFPTTLSLILLTTAAIPIRGADEAPKRASLGEVWAVAYSPESRDADPMHFTERREHKAAMHDAVEGMEKARVALATAIQRIKDWDAKSRSGGA